MSGKVVDPELEALLNQIPENDLTAIEVDEVVEDEVVDDDVDEVEETEPTARKALKLTPYKESVVKPVDNFKADLDALKDRIAELNAADTPQAKEKAYEAVIALTNSLEYGNRIPDIKRAFNKVFGESVNTLDVFESQEWRDFNQERVYGKPRSELYTEAAANGETDVLEMHFNDFLTFMGNPKPVKKPPVTPRSNVAAGASPKVIGKQTVVSASSKFENAMNLYLEGKLAYSEVLKYKTVYDNVLKKAA